MNLHQSIAAFIDRKLRASTLLLVLAAIVLFALPSTVRAADIDAVLEGWPAVAEIVAGVSSELAASDNDVSVDPALAPGGVVVSVDEFNVPQTSSTSAFASSPGASWIASSSTADGVLYFVVPGGTINISLVGRGAPSDSDRAENTVLFDDVLVGANGGSVDQLQVLSDGTVEELLLVRGVMAQSAQSFRWTVNLPDGFTMVDAGGFATIYDNTGMNVMDIKSPEVVDSASNHYHPTFALEEGNVVAVSFDPVVNGAVGDWALDPTFGLLSAGDYETGNFQYRISNAVGGWMSSVTSSVGEPNNWSAAYGGSGSADYDVGQSNSTTTDPMGVYTTGVAGATVDPGAWARHQYNLPNAQLTGRRFTCVCEFTNSLNKLSVRAVDSAGHATAWATTNGDITHFIDVGDGGTHFSWAGMSVINNGAVGVSGSGRWLYQEEGSAVDYINVVMVDTTNPAISVGQVNDESRWYNASERVNVEITASDAGSGIWGFQMKRGSTLDTTVVPTCNNMANISVEADTPCDTASTSYPLSFPANGTSVAQGSNSIKFIAQDFGQRSSSDFTCSPTCEYKYDSAAPTAPANLGAMTPSPSDDATAVGLNSIGMVTLGWAGFSDPNGASGSGIATYEICFSTISQTPGACGPGWVSTQSSSAAVDVFVNVASNYYWQIRAVDAAGNKSSASPEASFTADIVAPTVVFSAPSDDLSKRTAGNETFSGTVSDAGAGVNDVYLKYRVFGTATWTTLSTDTDGNGTFSFSQDLPSDGLYDVRIEATDNATSTNNLRVTTPINVCRDTATLTQPTTVNHEFLDGGTARIWWTSVSDIAGYFVEQRATPGGTFTQIAKVTSGISPLAVTASGLSGTDYEWRVQTYGYACSTEVKDTGTVSSATGSSPAAGAISSYPQIGNDSRWTMDGISLGGSTAGAVNVAGGNLVVATSLTPNKGQGLDTSISLTYNSQDITPTASLLATNGIVGANWTLSLEGLSPGGGIDSFTGIALEPITITTNGGDEKATVRDGDGTRHVFDNCESGDNNTEQCPDAAYTGKFKQPAGAFLRLRAWNVSYESDPGTMGVPAQQVKYVATRPDRVSYYWAEYDAGALPAEDGRLLAVKDRDGNTLTMKYECIAVDDTTREVTVPGITDCASYSSPPGGSTKRYRLTKVTDQGGRDMTLAYYDPASGNSDFNRDGRLKSVTDHAGVRTEFNYDRLSSSISASPARLTSTIAAASDGKPWVASTAYKAGDCVTKIAPDGAYFRVTVAGTSDGTEPGWPSTNGEKVVDVATFTRDASCARSSMPAWTASTLYTIGQCVTKATADGTYFRVTTGGTSDGSEPSWPSTEGSTVTDGPVFTKDSGCPATQIAAYRYTSTNNSFTSVEDESMRIASVADSRGSATKFWYQTPDKQGIPRVSRMMTRANNAANLGAHKRYNYSVANSILSGTSESTDEDDSVITYSWETTLDDTVGRVTRIIGPLAAPSNVVSRLDYNSDNRLIASHEIAPRVSNETKTLTDSGGVPVPFTLNKTPFDTTQSIIVSSAADGGGDLHVKDVDYTVNIEPASPEVVTLTGTSNSVLDVFPIDPDQPVVVRSSTSDAGVLYLEGVDYQVVSRANGQIARLAGSSIPSGTDVYVSYRPTASITRINGGGIASGELVYISYTPIHATTTTRYDVKTGLIGSQWDPSETATTTTYTNNSDLDGYVADVDLITTPRGSATTGDLDDFQTNYTYTSNRVTSIASPINAGSGSGSDISTSTYNYYSSTGNLRSETNGRGYTTGYSQYDASGNPKRVHARFSGTFNSGEAAIIYDNDAAQPDIDNFAVYDTRGGTLCADDKREASDDAPGTTGVPDTGDTGACVFGANNKVFEESIYDALGNAVRTTSPWDATKRRATRNSYDANSNAVAARSSIGYVPGTTTPELPDTATKGAVSASTLDEDDRETVSQSPPNFDRFVTSATYAVGNCTASTDPDNINGYIAESAGAASTEPTWPTTEGTTVTTGAVTFRNSPTCKRKKVTIYNPDSTIAKVTEPQGTATPTANDYAIRNSYDTAGRLVGEIDGENNLTCHYYDNYNNETGTNLPIANPTADGPDDCQGSLDSDYDTSQTFDKRHQALTEVDVRGKSTASVYDSEGNVTSVTDPESNTTDTTYTADGKVRTVQLPSISACSDAVGHISGASCVATVAARPTTTSTYDENGNVATVTSPRSVEWNVMTFVNSTPYILNQCVEPNGPNGHVYKVTTAGTSGSTEPTWNTGVGSTTNSGGVVFTENACGGSMASSFMRTITYDTYDVLTKTELPRQYTTGYNPNGAADTTLYTHQNHDSLERLTDTSLQTSQSSWGSVANAEKTSWTYYPDGAINVKTDTPNDVSSSNTYDVLGEQAARTEHGSTLSYTYFPNGSIKTDSSVQTTAAKWQKNHYYALGQCVTKTSPDGNFFLVTTPGLADSIEPTWPTTMGNSVTGYQTLGPATFTKSDCLTNHSYDLSGQARTTWQSGLIYLLHEKRDKTGKDLQVRGYDLTRTTNTYDKNGNTLTENVDGLITTHTYGTSGEDTNQLSNSVMQRNGIGANADVDFTYDDNGELEETTRDESTDLKTVNSQNAAGMQTRILTIDPATGKVYQDENYSYDLEANIRKKTENLRVADTDVAAWTASHSYVKGDIVKPTSENGHYYQVTDDGASDGSQPAWPTTVGGSVQDGTGNLTFTEFTQVTAYTYDAQNRVLRDDLPGATGDGVSGMDPRKYVYTTIGALDRIENPACSSPTTYLEDYTYEGTNPNQITTQVIRNLGAAGTCSVSTTDTRTFAYGDDSDGKPKGTVVGIDSSVGSDITYTHDDLNRQAGAAQGSEVESIAYDAEGRRAADAFGTPLGDEGSHLTYKYSSDEQSAVGEDDSNTIGYDAKGTLKDPNDNIIVELRDNSTRLMLTDQVGSITSSTTDAGVVKTTLDNDTFGESGGKLESDSSVPEVGVTTSQFSGSRIDDVAETTHHEARDLSSESRVWLQADQYLDAEEDQSLSLGLENLNRSAYAGLNPITNNDPDGHLKNAIAKGYDASGHPAAECLGYMKIVEAATPGICSIANNERIRANDKRLELYKGEGSIKAGIGQENDGKPGNAFVHTYAMARMAMRIYSRHTYLCCLLFRDSATQAAIKMGRIHERLNGGRGLSRNLDLWNNIKGAKAAKAERCRENTSLCVMQLMGSGHLRINNNGNYVVSCWKDIPVKYRANHKSELKRRKTCRGFQMKRPWR